MVNLFIANTDNDWFDFLSSQLDVPEANFWQPSGKGFHAIREGEILAFRLKSPRNKIGGFGILSSSSVYPLQIAWETFGPLNGAASYAALRDAIAPYRPGELVGPTTNIGCRILVEPVFFPPDLWIELPPSWAPNIMGGKRFSTEEEEGRDLWYRLQETAQILRSSLGVPGILTPAARFGKPTLITPRLGQRAFRFAVTEAYDRQCAISDGKVLPALDAAHIRPYADEGEHVTSNGILLRKDIHSVLDAGYVTIDTNYQFIVSNKVKEIFNNGNEYLRLHGKRIRLPKDKKDWPHPDFLRWHNKTRFEVVDKAPAVRR